MSSKAPAYAAVVIHEVEDYETWRAKFEEHESARRAAGIQGHHVNRSADNPNLLAVYLPHDDVDALRAFLTDDGLRAAMKDAGVKGTPDIKVMKVESEDAEMSEPHAGLIVVHQVEDYARWRAAYDGFDAKRKELGIIGHAVNTMVDDRNNVVVYHQADSVETLHAFMQSDELKARMAEAGVSGKPQASFWTSQPAKMY